MTNVFDITEFGAIGDGKFDCTAAIQAALDAAGEVRGAVIVPPGNYRCKDLLMHRGTTIRGFDAWGFRRPNASWPMGMPAACSISPAPSAPWCAISVWRAKSSARAFTAS